MKKGINVGNDFYMECKHCHQEYNLVKAKRDAKRSEPIRCPNCGCVVAR